jgi:hypothetical protein
VKVNFVEKSIDQYYILASKYLDYQLRLPQIKLILRTKNKLLFAHIISSLIKKQKIYTQEATYYQKFYH